MLVEPLKPFTGEVVTRSVPALRHWPGIQESYFYDILTLNTSLY